MIEHPGYRRRLQQLLEFDGRVLYQSYTSNPFTVHTEFGSGPREDEPFGQGRWSGER